MVGDADALADGSEGSVLEQFAQFGLAGEHEGDGGARVEVKVHHSLDGGESGGGEVLSVIDDDDGFAVQFGNGLEEQLAGLAGEERGIDLETFEDGLDESCGGEAGAADVKRGVAVAVEGGDEGGESDRLAAADGAGEQQQVLVGDAEGETRRSLLVGAGREGVGGREVLAERQTGETEEGKNLINGATPPPIKLALMGYRGACPVPPGRRSRPRPLLTWRPNAPVRRPLRRAGTWGGIPGGYPRIPARELRAAWRGMAGIL